MPSTSATAGSCARCATRASLSAPHRIPPIKPNAVSHGSYAFGLVGACGSTARNCSRSPRSVMNRVHTANPPGAVRRWSVKPIRIDFTPSLVPKSSRTVWFASVWGVNFVSSCIP